MLIVLRGNQLCKTSTRHRKNSKQSGIVAIGSFFAIIAALQYGVTTRESSVGKKNPAHSDFSPNLELTTPTKDRITPCHVSPGLVRRPISDNPGLNFNPGLSFFSSKAFSRTIFSNLFRVANHQIVDKKN